MANYKINKGKSISVLGELTAIEKDILAAYIKSGYVIKEKRSSSAARISNDDIVGYFQSKMEAAAEDQEQIKKINDELAAYQAKKKEKRDGKDIGFLGASKWFKESYYEAYDKIMCGKERDFNKSYNRQKKAAKAAADALKAAEAAVKAIDEYTPEITAAELKQIHEETKKYAEAAAAIFKIAEGKKNAKDAAAVEKEEDK